MLQCDWVDELVECRTGSGEGLGQTDTLGTMYEGKDLGDVDVSHWVHHGVEHVVDEDHGHNRTGSLGVLGLSVVGTGTGPASEENSHTAKSDQVLSSALELTGQQGGRAAGDEVPAGESEVDQVLGSLVCDTNSRKDLG